MIRVKLFDGDTDYKSDIIPRWWLNFAESTGDDLTTVDEANIELMNWSASFWIAKHKENKLLPGDRYLDFYDEQAYTWFIMRWA